MPVQPAVPTLPGSPVRRTDGEIIYRTYRAVQLPARRRGEGILYVTDSRIVFYAWAKSLFFKRSSSLVQQTKISEVLGLQSYVSRRFSLWLALFAVLLATWAIAVLAVKSEVSSSVSVGPQLTIIAVVLLALGAACILVMLLGAAKRGSAGVTIHTNHGTYPIDFGKISESSAPWAEIFLHPFRSLFRAYTAFDVRRGRPGLDSEIIVADLGALILDLQTRGTEAAGYWGIDTEAQRARSRYRL